MRGFPSLPKIKLLMDNVEKATLPRSRIPCESPTMGESPLPKLKRRCTCYCGENLQATTQPALGRYLGTPSMFTYVL